MIQLRKKFYPIQSSMKKLSLVRGLLLYLCIVCSIHASAQTDTAFWFAAPATIQSSGANQRDQPLFLRMMNTEAGTATVKVYCPANPSLTYTTTIAANSVQSYDLTSWLTNIVNSTPNVILNRGLKVESDKFITVYYDQASTANPEMFAFKGRNALGTQFYVPGQSAYDNDSRDTVGNGLARDSIYGYNSFDIVASEDHTIVTITPSKNIVGHIAGIAFNVTLNKGQTFSCRAVTQSKTGHLGGSSIIADKLVAVTMKDDFLKVTAGAGGSDLGGDQLIPVGLLGQEYISVNGYFSDVDRASIMAVEDNTKVYVDGVLKATLSAGAIYEHTYTSNTTGQPIYINADHPVSVMHITGAAGELGSAVLPPIGGCTGSASVGIVRPGTSSFYLIILVPKTSLHEEQKFTLNGGAGIIKSTDFNSVPGTTGWQYARVAISTTDLAGGASGIVTTTNSAIKFHLGIIYGTGSGGSYGYFSNYATYNPSLSTNASICEGQQLNLYCNLPPELTGATDITFQWTGPNNFTSTLQNPVVGSLTAGQYTYTAKINRQGCFYSILSTTATVGANPVAAITGTNVLCEGANLSLTATDAGTGAAYSWSGPNSFTSNASSAQINTVVAATHAGTYNLSVTKNGCTSTASSAISINMKPPAVISGSNTICEGGNLSLTAQNAGAIASYNWTGPNGFSSNSTSAVVNNVISATHAGVYNLTITNNGCTSTASSTVTINTNPVAAISGTNVLCAGANLNLSAQTVAGAAYSWTGPNSFSSGNSSAMVDNVAATHAGAYNLSVTKNGCTSTASSTVTINANPIAAIIGTNVLCEGANLSLTATDAGTGAT
ncbi:MAG: hypothetical protein JWN76_3574, partial [Chitinophagaceae bacterium]|nr:hypothetical protein [Chitinophagaceae bacterium]